MAKRIMLFVIAFTVAAAVIFTGCTPARRPMNTGTQYNRTGTQYNRTGPGVANNQYDAPLTNNWGTRDTSYNNGTLNNNTSMGTNTGYGANTGSGTNNGYGTNVGYNTTSTQNDALQRTIEQIQGVRNATVVISGNTAYVGVTLDTNTTNTANTTNIKNLVAQQIRTTNRAITTVYVSTDKGFINRLRNVGNGINGGRPISGFTNELNNMVRRITPTSL